MSRYEQYVFAIEVTYVRQNNFYPPPPNSAAFSKYLRNFIFLNCVFYINSKIVQKIVVYLL